MTLRSLLVLLDGAPTCEARVNVAIQLAKDHDCHLLGVAATDLLETPTIWRTDLTLSDYAARIKDALRDQAERAADGFRARCQAAGLRSHSAEIDESEVVRSLVRHAHCSDLAVVSQVDSSAPGHGSVRALVQAMILQSARPTLVVPRIGSYSGDFKTAMVAWDDSREASRAVRDALPILQRARKVRVVGWREHGADAASKDRLEALQGWLMRHGVATEMRLQSIDDSIDIANAMLSLAADLEADLIVMGAYGHARLSEFVLGGATRGLLQSMTVPVLLSH